ncbi:MAG TPA: thioesterase family protein [Acidimicrobiales bacterium]
MDVGQGIGFAKQLEMDREGGPGGAGRWRVDVSPDWNCPTVPQGGVMAALAGRAMTRELGDDLPLRSLTTVFAAPVAHGPVEIDVTVLRRGRSLSQARAEVRNPGAQAGHSVLAVFGRERPGFAFTDAAMPDVPAPEDCPSYRDGPPDDVAPEPERPDFLFWEKIEGRAALGHAPWEEYVPTTSECATWLRFDDPPHRPDGTLEPLSAVVFSDTMPGAVRERMGPGTPWFMPPSADLTVHLFAEPRSEWLLAHYRAHRAGGGYATTSVDVWDPDPSVGLVARGTQVMLVLFPGGPPPPEQLVPFDHR